MGDAVSITLIAFALLLGSVLGRETECARRVYSNPKPPTPPPAPGSNRL